MFQRVSIRLMGFLSGFREFQGVTEGIMWKLSWIFQRGCNAFQIVLNRFRDFSNGFQGASSRFKTYYGVT